MRKLNDPRQIAKEEQKPKDPQGSTPPNGNGGDKAKVEPVGLFKVIPPKNERGWEKTLQDALKAGLKHCPLCGRDFEPK